eukprot:1977300-Rhodomonas_salina.2
MPEQTVVGEEQGKSVRVHTLSTLPGTLLVRIWPADSVVIGTRVSKFLLEELRLNADNVTFRVKTKPTEINITKTASAICEDLVRFRKSKITLRSAGPQCSRGRWLRHWLLGWTWRSLSLQRSLVEISLHQAQVRDADAAKLGMTLSLCEGLQKLHLSSNSA